ncbi:MAG: hypothetical protein ACU0BF_05505 [Paracoccaceae bacterium]
MLIAALLAGPAAAETASYGRIDLHGLARDNSWPLNPPGRSYAMVCNVNGPDGFLSIRNGPGTQHAVNRSLKRLAILDVDTAQRIGNWVAVRGAHRTHHADTGQPVTFRDLPVTGWAHDGYLCDFIDY